MPASFRLVCLLVVFAGCGFPSSATQNTQSKVTPMPAPIVEFTDAEQRTLAELQIAVFRNKIILDAQPPITADQLAAVQAKVDGKLSPDLLALWNTSFGGALDYDYDVLFGDHLYSASLRELFYPNSEHYDDLNGWIENEIEVLQEIAEARDEPIPRKTPFVPFGGFEYLERFYVSLLPNEYGSVLVYAQGIPWKGRLNEDSVTITADSLGALFDQLALYQDPFEADPDDYASGTDIVARIAEIEADHPELAAKLKRLLRASIIDWRRIVETTDFANPISPAETQALRLGLANAANHSDLQTIDQLHLHGAPFDVTVTGKQGVLGLAMMLQKHDVVDRLLTLNVDVGDAPVVDATNCSDELLQRLIGKGVRFDEHAIFTAASTGAIDGAIALAQSKQVVDPPALEKMIATAEERAVINERDAAKVESGKLGSYLTAEQYRQRAVKLREFAKRLRSE
ncbi:hypothetical protein C5Y97_30075 [Blastopirellula marina]|uniref:Knr4/Smi1-like domain-containing protein n=2 Tax=Blastopirellula marina TaxID=124 RepID=A0A2S8F3C7_9BACT|nr:hypothetical protein C5Y98_30060 [Blastopirellula marina]PTL40938.1 hypothetical protein C5Y97_30075 [Blastopirellula marina]